MKLRALISGNTNFHCVIFSIAVAALCVGCGKQAATPDASGAVDASTAAASPAKPNPYAWPAPKLASDDHDPCSLLDPKQVEPFLGEPLAVSPYRAGSDGTPDATGEYCTYRGKSLHAIVVDVEWKNGEKMMKMLGGITTGMNKVAKGEVKLPINGTTLDGDWDVATIANCCTLMALRDDTLVTVDVSRSKATQEQAAKLADDAMKNLAKPLPIDGSASIDAATKLLQSRPSVANDCALITRAEAEAALGPLSADPLQRDSYCAYRFTNARGHADEVSVKVKTNGFHAFRENNNIYETAGQQSTQMSAGMNEQSKALLAGFADTNAHKPEPAGPWDDATSSQFEFDLVKRDVFVQIGGATHDQMRALAEKAAARL